MLSEQKNRPSFTKSISFAGITKHSRITRRLRNQRFNHQPREVTSLLRDNPHFNRHPYKAQKENLSVLQRQSTEKSLFKNRRRFSRKFGTGDMRILDEDMSLNTKMISVLSIADQLKKSLNMQQDKTEAKDDINTCIHPLKDWHLKRHKSENMEKRGSGSQSASQLEGDINKDQTHSLHLTNAEREEDDIISTPCLGEEISYPVGDSTEKTTVLPLCTSNSEKKITQRAETPSCEEQKEYCSPNVGKVTSSDLEDHLSRLETSPMFDLEDFDQDFSITIVLCPKSPSFTTTSSKETVDSELEGLYSPGDADIDPDLRDLLCVESPTQKPDENRRLTSDDYRQALTVQDKCTCLYCGSNLEIIPFENWAGSPNDIHDFFYDPDDNYSWIASPHYSNYNDLTMFCPLCCENRLVQNYGMMHN